MRFSFPSLGADVEADFKKRLDLALPTSREAANRRGGILEPVVTTHVKP